MSLYLDAYDAAVMRHWAALLSRHHASLRRPWARDRLTAAVDNVTNEPPTIAEEVRRDLGI